MFEVRCGISDVFRVNRYSSGPIMPSKNGSTANLVGKNILLEARSRKSEVRSRKSEVGSQKSEVGSLTGNFIYP